MSEHWEYRRDLIEWLLALPFSLLPVALVVPILAVVDFIPLLWSRTPRRAFRQAVAHLASDLSLFLQPPPSPAERREIGRRWQESLRNLPRKRRVDVAELLRVFLNLQRPGTVAGSPAAALYARRDGGDLELVVRATSSRFANDCTAGSATQATEWTGPCLDFALEHDGRPLGVLRLRGVDHPCLVPVRAAPGRTGRRTRRHLLRVNAYHEASRRRACATARGYGGERAPHSSLVAFSASVICSQRP